MFNLTYWMAILQIILGFIVIFCNKKIAPKETSNPTSEYQPKESQIPLLGLILIAFGDIILIVFLIESIQ